MEPGVGISLGPRVAHWVAWQVFLTPSRVKLGPSGRFIFRSLADGGPGRRKPMEGRMTVSRKAKGGLNTLSVFLMVVWTPIALSGCMSAAEHRAAVRDDSGERLTVGTVQRKIHVGMPASDVATVMGSPNIVTTDEKRREVWIYDKIATERVYSTSEGGVSTLILGGALVGPGLVGGAVAPHGSQSAGASSTTQRTLTVIIKYDEYMKVRDFSYHSTQF